MIDRQRRILDPEERREYINDVQRYLATKMYIVPYTAAPGVYAFQPYMRYRDHEAMYIKGTYGMGQEFVPGLWVDRAGAGGSASFTGAAELRIIARRLADGRIEFGLRTSSGAQVLPSRRYFPATPTPNRWLYSSDISSNGVELGQIAARRLVDGRTEFGFVDSAGQFASINARYLPTDAPVGRWLQSSSFEIAVY